jgi:hypothetical protein
MPNRLYARLRENVNIRLRRGAWYRVLKLQDLEAILDVNGRPRTVATALLEIVKQPPPRWTVVSQRPDGARKAPLLLRGALRCLPELRRAGSAAAAGSASPLRLLQVGIRNRLGR